MCIIISDDKAFHHVTLINGVKVAIVEMEGVIYLEMYDSEPPRQPITIAKIDISGVHRYGAELTPDRLEKLLYNKTEKIISAPICSNSYN